MLPRQGAVEPDHQIEYLVQARIRSRQFIGRLRVYEKIDVDIAVAGVAKVNVCNSVFGT